MKHVVTINGRPTETPGTAFPDGAFTGNGDLGLVVGGQSDRVRLYLSKADFWKADWNAYRETRGGIAPIGYMEILLPQLAYAPFHVEEDIDNATLTLTLRDGDFDATLSVRVCAVENTVLLSLKRSFPGLSASVSLFPIEGNGAKTERGERGGLSFMTRGFDSPDLDFPSEAVCVLKKIDAVSENGLLCERWVLHVETNHDSAAYRKSAFTVADSLDADEYGRLSLAHETWWRDFWERSSVSLPTEPELEKGWYVGIYALACSERNQRFPSGLWGNFVTSDGMGWFGDYHLNYNYEAPYYCLFSANHAELSDNYTSPLFDFMSRGRKYAKEYLGCQGIYYPVALGPIGSESDLRPDTKEHGHLFLGQKSNAAYAATILSMRWKTERNLAYAKTIYPYFLAVSEFWEDYLFQKDGKYEIRNDSLNEVEYWSGADYMPKLQDDCNPIISIGLIRSLFKTVIDLAGVLGRDADKIPLWKEIIEKLPTAKTFMRNGKTVLRATDNHLSFSGLALQYVFPAEQIGKYETPDLYAAAQNTFLQVGEWEHTNWFCAYYAIGARLGIDPDILIAHFKEAGKNHLLPNGLYRFFGGGLENCTAAPFFVNEMFLQSNEGTVRLFPCWNHEKNASFDRLRAYGNFTVSAKLENRVLSAEIVSGGGEILRLEAPGEGYTAKNRRSGRKIPLTDPITDIPTEIGDVIEIGKAESV